jgi:FkbM family methyltransferase
MNYEEIEKTITDAKLSLGIGSGVGDEDIYRTIERVRYESNKDEYIIFDCGAHVGGLSSMLARIDGAKVYAFEPLKQNYELLVENTRELGNVLCYKFAISQCEIGMESFHYDKAHTALSSLIKRNTQHHNFDMNQIEQVPATSLQYFCTQNNIEAIDMLKLDIEGAEFSVLQHSIEMVAKKKIKNIIFEFGGTNIDSRTFFQDFWYLLKDHCYFYRITPSGFQLISEYHERHENFQTTNFLCKLK